jgi:hypothetical protein
MFNYIKSMVIQWPKTLPKTWPPSWAMARMAAWWRIVGMPLLLELQTWIQVWLWYKDWWHLIHWEFQDPKLEVLYHIRPYFVGIFPYIGLI